MAAGPAAWRAGTRLALVTGSLLLGFVAGTVLLTIAACFSFIGLYIGMAIIVVVGDVDFPDYSWVILLGTTGISGFVWSLAFLVPAALALHASIRFVVAGYALGLVMWITAVVRLFTTRVCRDVQVLLCRAV